MRIIAGKHKGRKIETNVGKATRPTKGIVKEALFNILLHRYTKEDGSSILSNAIIADIFCGTGAVALEAISRGAKKAYAVDNDKKTLEYLNYNAKILKEEENIKTIWSDIKFLPSISQPCDIVFIDPPYRASMLTTAIESLEHKNWLHQNSIIIVELAKKEEFKVPDKYKISEERIYGNSKILILEKI